MLSCNSRTPHFSEPEFIAKSIQLLPAGFPVSRNMETRDAIITEKNIYHIVESSSLPPITLVVKHLVDGSVVEWVYHYEDMQCWYFEWNGALCCITNVPRRLVIFHSLSSPQIVPLSEEILNNKKESIIMAELDRDTDNLFVVFSTERYFRVVKFISEENYTISDTFQCSGNPTLFQLSNEICSIDGTAVSKISLALVQSKNCSNIAQVWRDTLVMSTEQQGILCPNDETIASFSYYLFNIVDTELLVMNETTIEYSLEEYTTPLYPKVNYRKCECRYIIFSEKKIVINLVTPSHSRKLSILIPSEVYGKAPSLKISPYTINDTDYLYLSSDSGTLII
jgi:hypothetical protein